MNDTAARAVAAAALPCLPVKVGFVLLSPSAAPIPSTRIAALHMFPFLHDAGFDPVIAYDPPAPREQPDVSAVADELLESGCEIVVFQKVHGAAVQQLITRLRARGIKTVWLVCDLVDPAMAAAVDATVVVTDHLKSLYPRELQAAIHVVHDGVERSDVCKTDWGETAATRAHPLRAVLVTSAALDRLPVLDSLPPWLDLTIVGRYPPEGDVRERLRMIRWQFGLKRRAAERLRYLRFLLDRRIHCVPWHADAVYRALQQADVGIIPIDTEPGKRVPDWDIKSENRLTMKMAMALPVVATPIPSYEPVVEQGRNGFLARSRDEWIEHLNALREPALRREIGTAARASVLDRYSKQQQARRLIEVLRGLTQ